MEYTQGYGSLVIRFDRNGGSYLSAAKGKDILKEVLPDAVEFVTLYSKTAMRLSGINGFDIIVYPNMSVRTLISEYHTRFESAKNARNSEPAQIMV